MATPIPANDAAFTLEEVLEATRGTIARRGLLASARGVTTDSREVVAGGLFIALRGEQNDAHRFLPQVAERAAIALVERGRAIDASLTQVEVEDTLVAFGDLARFHLARWRAGNTGRKVIAITGSAGKTTTKELTAALCGAVGATHRTAGNLNNRVGVPSVVLGLTEDHLFAVLEMGMSLPGELDAITSFARPDVAIVTNVGLAHAEGVGGLEGVMREKGAVYRALAPEGVAIVNADDPLVLRAAEGTAAGAVVSFGLGDTADYRLTTRQPRAGGGADLGLVFSQERIGLAPRLLQLRFPLSGEAAAIDLAAALVAQEAATATRLEPAAIEAALDTIELAGRATLKQLGGDVLVLDDTYNANPASMRAALLTLAEVAGPRRRVAVLGEMKELGAHADAAHDALAEDVAAAGVAVAIGCGGLVSRTLALLENRQIVIVDASSTAAAAAAATALVRRGDVVLVKGSRSVGAEKVVAQLSESWPKSAESDTSGSG